MTVERLRPQSANADRSARATNCEVSMLARGCTVRATWWIDSVCLLVTFKDEAGATPRG
ncbi:hypothetical protein HMPREF0970_01165 [Schaalia odontolytica F0309]|uniref:Uncharacterized protein n=1 Tax=Schaalia odontolytica F0309 TaxID=649742 RepID=D4TYY6_9ACTO|nr:hypothetical protein HMPREF0970_01165 [Schaalia odontolytica F0309]